MSDPGRPFATMDEALAALVGAVRAWRSAAGRARSPFAWGEGVAIEAEMAATGEAILATWKTLAGTMREAEAEALARFEENGLAALQADVRDEVILLTAPTVGLPS